MMSYRTPDLQRPGRWADLRAHVAAQPTSAVVAIEYLTRRGRGGWVQPRDLRRLPKGTAIRHWHPAEFLDYLDRTAVGLGFAPEELPPWIDVIT